MNYVRIACLLNFCADCLRTIFGQIGIWDSTYCSGNSWGSPACNYGINDGRRNLQRSQEVLQASFRSGFIGSCKHGHYRRLLHAERHPRRRGESTIVPISLFDFIYRHLHVKFDFVFDEFLLFRWFFQINGLLGGYWRLAVFTVQNIFNN